MASCHHHLVRGLFFSLGPVDTAVLEDPIRIPNGVDTDTSADWVFQNNFDLGIELGDANDLLGTPGLPNALIPEPATALLLGMGLLGGLIRRRR